MASSVGTAGETFPDTACQSRSRRHQTTKQDTRSSLRRVEYLTNCVLKVVPGSFPLFSLLVTFRCRQPHISLDVSLSVQRHPLHHLDKLLDESVEIYSKHPTQCHTTINGIVVIILWLTLNRNRQVSYIIKTSPKTCESDFFL